MPALDNKQKRRSPIHFGPAWSIVFVPLLFIAAGFSIPYSMFSRYLSARRERKFAEQMSRLGRTISWPNFLREANLDAGTIILESASTKGPVRWWWTSEAISAQLSGLAHGEIDGSNWNALKTKWAASDKAIRERFTGVDGIALLITGTSQQKKAIRDSGGLPQRWRQVHIGPSMHRFLMEFPEELT